MNDLPWFAHFPRDFLIEVLGSGISDLEELWLRRLIDMAWSMDGRLPNDDKSLARMARCTDCEWIAARENLMAFFRVTDGFWRRETLCDQIKTAGKKHNVLSEAGQKGSSKRWKDKVQLNNSQANGHPNDQAIGQANKEANSHPNGDPNGLAYARGDSQKQQQEGSSTEESKTPLPRTRARNRHIPNKINGLGVTRGRSAPLARPPASPKTNGIRLKSRVKELLRQKLYRFVDANLSGDERHAAMLGLSGADPETSEQQWFDRLDRQMRTANWDDVPA